MQPKLTEKESTELQTQMTQHMIKKICRLYSKRNFVLEIRYAANPKLKNPQKEMERWLGNNFIYKKQIGKDLGSKMTNAFKESFEDGFENILLLGSDIPDIDHKEHLDTSFSYLIKHEKDCVIGPAYDGGYYLIGLNKRVSTKYWDEIFKNISWGTKEVLNETKPILRQYNIKYSLLEKLNDVDLPEDIEIWENAKNEMENYEKEKKISVIIPVLNEGKNFLNSISSMKHGKNIEIIGLSFLLNFNYQVVDGGSEDETIEIASELPNVTLIETTKGKANQMNTGAEYSTGDILFFLHGDTIVPKHFDTIIRTTLIESRDTIMGAFSFQTDIDNLFGMKLMNRVTNWRSRMLQLPYGDQGLFINKQVFIDNGGFPDIDFFEDFQFVRRIQKKGFIRIANAPAITSSRRWIKKGVFYSIL
eukprot:gene986-9893_t